MISKKNFIKYLKKIKELDDAEDKITDSLRLIGSIDFSSFSLEKPITLALEILKDAIDDKYDYISYFIYELNWGQDKMAKNCVTEKDGTKRSLQTIEQLYDYIK